MSEGRRKEEVAGSHKCGCDAQSAQRYVDAQGIADKQGRGDLAEGHPITQAHDPGERDLRSCFRNWLTGAHGDVTSMLRLWRPYWDASDKLPQGCQAPAQFLILTMDERIMKQ